MKFGATKTYLLSFLALYALASPGPAYATDCSAWPEFQTTEPDLAPQSIDLSTLQNVLNAGDEAEGMIFEFKKVDGDVWMDIGYVPGEASALAGLRTAFMTFRLLSDDFDEFVFSDGETGLYKIPEPTAREIGCQFIWGREGGQNPIYLMRVFYQNLLNFEDGQLAVVGFNGSLMGDTNLAMTFNNEVFVKKWLLTALEQ